MLVFILTSFATSGFAHVVDAVGVEFDEIDGEWRIGGVMDLAYVLPETRGVEEQGPLSRYEVTQHTVAQHERYRRETEKFLRERIELRLGDEPIDYEVIMLDPIVEGISQMPEDPEDIAFLTAQIVAPVVDDGRSLTVHWWDDLEASLVISYLDGEGIWQIIPVEPGGSHTVLPGDGDEAVGAKRRFTAWLDEGFRHVLPLGLDHAAFMIALFCIAGTLKRALLLSLIFTLAHGISLVALVAGWIVVPGKFVEIVIGASIVWAGIEAWRGAKLSGKRLFFPVFAFGILHGMGFGAILAEKTALLSGAALVLPMVGFNIGVELAQICLVLGCALLVLLATRGWYRAAGVLTAIYGLPLVIDRVV